MHQEGGGRLKGWPWVVWFYHRVFFIPFGEEVEGAALSFLFELQRGRRRKLGCDLGPWVFIAAAVTERELPTE